MRKSRSRVGRVVAAAIALAPCGARAEPWLSICLATEGETGEQSDCPDPSPNADSTFYNSTWQPFGPDTATVSDSVSAAWSVLTGKASVYAKWGAAPNTGFVNDHNLATAILDADDFVITGPAGPVSFTMNVYLNGAVHAFSNDLGSFPALAGVNITGTIFKKIEPPIGPQDTCPMSIGGGNITSSNTAAGGYGVYTDHIGGPALFTSDPCTVQAGATFRVRLNLSAGASLTTPIPYDYPAPGTEGSASSSFAVGLPSSGPVFNLPVGYTASSAIADVEDNGYLPEPRAAASSATGSLALAALARSRRRRAAHTC